MATVTNATERAGWKWSVLNFFSGFNNVVYCLPSLWAERFGPAVIFHPLK